MIKLFLILGLLAHLSTYSQSIEKLLTPPYQINQYVKADDSTVLINFANHNLNSLVGFGEIVRYINMANLAQNRTVAITLANNHLRTLDSNDFIQFITESPVENLNISDNKLKKLPPHFLSGKNKFNDSLRIVLLRRNHLKRLPHNFLISSSNLTTLDLSENDFGSSPGISRHFLDNKPKLKALIIAGRYPTPPKTKGHKSKRRDADLDTVCDDPL